MPMPRPIPGAGAPAPQGVAGPASAPGPMKGAAAGGMTKLKMALKGMQEALPELPMGSAIHTSVLKALTDIGKAVEKEGGGGQGDPGAMIQQLVEMARNAKQAGAPPPQMPGAGGPMPPMGGAPPVPPPQMGA